MRHAHFRFRCGTLPAALGALLICAPLAAQSPSPEMNFFLAAEGPGWGADQPALEVADSHCMQLGYAQGFGHLQWRAYLTGEAAGGVREVARERIGTGPWYNYYGVPIAESLAQLHSDDNNLWSESAVTQLGEMAPDGAVEIPWGSELDGEDFSREGPFLCFGVPG